MKKSLLFAALAVVAMASCTKNELKVPSTGSDAVISFQPVVANATKADYITNSSIAPIGSTSDFKFTVYAWYTDNVKMTASTTTATATKYMDAVEVSYQSRHNDSTDGQGGWSPETKYYWPKNGYLSFDAYAPSAASSDGTFSSVVEDGLQIADYTVKDLNQQYDLLYSKRTLNKKNSTEGATNDTYDGVDIAFKHALAAIEVTAKTDADYGTDAIKLNKVSILYAYKKGNFSQGMANAITEDTPAWDNQNTEVDEYVLYDAGATLSDGASLSQTPLKSPTISNAILLPQSFDHTPTTTNTVSIKVDYSIKGTTDYLAQTQTFDLSDTKVGSTDQTGWEMGKRYTYNFIFSLEEIYFAPQVAEWTDVTVNDIDVK